MAHAVEARQNFQEALRLNPKSGLYQFGLASLLEELVAWTDEAKPENLPAEWRALATKDARAAYAKAFTLASDEYSKMKNPPAGGVVASAMLQAADAFLRLTIGVRNDIPQADKDLLPIAEETLARFAKLKLHLIPAARDGPVTPVVFSFQPAAHLEELLAPDKTVDFDLRGYGIRDRWPWIKPELGLLVWDPLQTGVIDSARQLFGGYTFQLFWKTGYDALAALDDDGDGALSGAELDGISVWFDRDGDGHSSAEEVTPLCSLGVVSIATRADSHDGLHPTNGHGLTLRDGRTLRTWDWMVQPVRRAALVESEVRLAERAASTVRLKVVGKPCCVSSGRMVTENSPAAPAASRRDASH